MTNEEKEIIEEETEEEKNTNEGGIKIVIDHDDSRFIGRLKDVISRIKKWRH